MALEITDKNFEEEIIKSDKPALVDFWAPWCGPCQIMGPIIDELSKDMGDKVKIGKVNVDENSAVASRFGIMSIPTIAIFKEGKVVKNLIGVQNIDTLKEELGKI